MSTDPQEAPRPLPDRPNLRHLKDQAKDLLKAGAESLTKAQFQIARLYGFASWPKLKAHVESLVVLGQLKRAIKQLIHIELFTNHLTRRGGLSLLNKIATTKLVGLKAQSAGNFIELPLESKYALRRAKSSKRSVRREVCSHSARANSYVRAIVRTRSVNRSS